MNKLKNDLLVWFATGRVGCSSKALACAVLDIVPNEPYHPLDPADFNRCLIMLEAAPDAKQHIGKAADLTPEWAAIIKHWGEVEKTFLDEVGLNWQKGSSAPTTHALMKDIYSSCRKKSTRARP